MNFANLVYRPVVQRSDRETVRDIVVSTGMFNEGEVGIAVELVDESLAKGEKTSGYYFLFAEAEGRVVGYSCYGPIAGTDNRFDLFWIVVHAASQNRGIGSLLMRETEKIASAMGARRIYVETSSQEKYLPTRAFYARHQYLTAATVPGFYSDTDDKCILCKQL